MSIQILQALSAVRSHNFSVPGVIVSVWLKLNQCIGSFEQLKVAAASESAWICKVQFPVVC